MKRNWTVPIAVICLLALLAGCGKEETPPEGDSSTAVETTTVTRDSIAAENQVSGQVASSDEQSVYVALSVRCTDVYVEVGDTVSAGQTICTLDMSSTWANYETASMSYQNARQSYEDQSAILAEQIAQAQKNVDDTQALFEAGAASQLELNNAKLALENAKAAKTSALSQLELSMQNYKASIEQLESSLANIDRNGNVAAPISGTVLSLSVAKNSFVSAAAPVVTIDSMANMEVQVSVSESIISKLHTGQTADVSISAVNKSFKATISKIGKAANAVSHLYGVTLQVPASAAAGLLSGMFADVTFYTDSQQNVVVIPTEAIQVGTDGQYVYTVDGSNVVHQVAVETGLVGDGVTEITSGLSGGETLVTVGQFYLSDGETVRIVSSEG